ncbi:MAG: 2-hydroxyacyl-CoA dehydratase [Deltaproteobacteria bacterium HGW-Deltaproteobacteria-2]|nr:MAG: 2-hydroxyacyl-CoA dehydratase [Deltaproteobacteria bacterium HGW-Deltaproteobacteria-2]
MKLNTVFDNTRNTIMRLPELSKGFFKRSLIGYYFSAPHPREALVFTKYWIMNWAAIIQWILYSIFKLGPITFIRKLIKHPWILILIRVNGLANRAARDNTGIYHDAICITVHSVTLGVINELRNMLWDAENLVIFEDLVPYDIARGMGLNCYMLELWGIILPILVSDGTLKYIDEAENSGMNPDACSLPKATVGMVLKGHTPKGVAMVSSNLPCDAGAASYAFIQRAYGDIPTYRLDAPYNFYNERAEQLFAKDVMGMIGFLEKHTPKRMDWNRMRRFFEGRNRMLELEMELWEMSRKRPSPVAGIAVWLSHLWHFNVSAGDPASIQHYEKLVKMARKNLENNIPAKKNERYRAVLWNPPFLHFSDIFIWAEKKYGIFLINDSMTYNHHEPIDTTSPETMVKGWGKTIMQGPMVRHTRGPAENYLEDIFRMVKQFDLDMVWVSNHVGCKGGQAMNGILREKCREKGIPLLVLDYDLSDERIVSHENMMRQVDFFMENVMKAKPIDQ